MSEIENPLADLDIINGESVDERTELEKNADAEAEASRTERDTDSESDDAALAQEVGAGNAEPVKSTISETTPPNPTPSRDVGVDKNAHRTSRQIRKDRQRGR